LQLQDGSYSAQIDTAQGAMVARFDALNRAVAERITLADRRQAMTLAVRKSHEDLLEAIIPAIDDANFDLVTASKATEKRRRASSSSIATSPRSAGRGQSSDRPLGRSIPGVRYGARDLLRDRVDAAQAKIEAKLGGLAQPEQRKKLTELHDRLAAMAGKDGVIALRTRELTAQRGCRIRFRSGAIGGD